MKFPIVIFAIIAASNYATTATSSKVPKTGVVEAHRLLPSVKNTRRNLLSLQGWSLPSLATRHGKSSKSSKNRRTPAPTTSTRPSASPSASPTMKPSISARPSFVPSAKPSRLPSASPSAQPTTQPSVSSKPSSNPSSKPSSFPSASPSSTPTKTPSVSPTSEPSSTPSFKPSLTPSVSPTSLPTRVPSDRPSLAPSASSAPSLLPSSQPSALPTINTIVGTKSLGGGGIQQGCDIPYTLDDSNFAEETVQRVLISFLYTLSFKKDANQADQVTDIENDLRNFVFGGYILCDELGQELEQQQQQDFLKLLDVDGDANLDLGEDKGEGQRRRQLRSKTESSRRLKVVESKPIGVSTGKEDERAMDLQCENVVEGELCVAMNGKFEMLFTDNAEISVSGEENFVLAAIKNAIENGDLKPSNPDTRGLIFIGKREGAFAAQSGVIPNVIDQNPNGNEKGEDGVSAVGGVFIGGSLLVVVVALLAAKKRKKSALYERNNEGALTSLRDSKGRDYDLYEIGPYEDDLDTFENTPYKGSPGHNSFPLILPVVTPGETSDASVEMKYLTRDVHRCSSALCQQCSGTNPNDRTRFIPSSEWYDDVEIDFSHHIRLNDGNSVRTYETPNTVTL